MIKSSFAELNIAMSGLTTAQYNVAVNAHNIANASTVGYTRQYTIQQACRPYSSSGGVGMWGTGSEVTSVVQYRSEFLDSQYRQKNATTGQYGIYYQQLAMAETTFGALGEEGLTAEMDAYFNAMQDLSTDPSSLTDRNNFINEAVAITEQISSIGEALQTQQSSVNAEIKSVVSEINSIGEQIVSLNNRIKLSEANGETANDLRDQRNVLVDQLSEYVNISVDEVQLNSDYDENDPTSGPSNLEFRVKINGYDFIKGDEYYPLECVEREDKVNEMDADGLYDIQFKNTGQSFDLYSSTLSGELRGLIDIRDGNNGTNTMVYDALQGKSVLAGSELPMPDPADYAGGDSDPDYISDLAKYADVDPANYSSDAEFVDAVVNKNVRGKDATGTLTTSIFKGLPHYMNKLNNFIRTLAVTMNEGSKFDTSSGYGKDAVKVDIDGVDGFINCFDLNGDEGELLFTYENNGVYQTDGEITDYTNINFNNFHVNPDLIEDPELLACSDSPDGAESNGEGIAQLLELKEDGSIFKEGTYQDYLIAITGELAIDVEHAEDFATSYAEATLYTENQRQSVSGVDLNQEVTYLTRNEQIYRANAQLISILNEMYDTCVNLGL